MEEQTLVVTLGDSVDGQQDQAIKYSIRGLDESEVDRWTEFCASIFSYKANPPPPSYFANHYYNDPRRDASLIRVAIYNDEIVSSCRIFRKTISTGGGGDGCPSLVEAGGIGEVCTLPNHRKRGLSKALLQNAIEIMTSQCKMQVSLLHAAPAFFPVYQKAGNYRNVLSRWSLVQFDHADLSLVDDDVNDPDVRPARFPSDTPRLMELHQRFSEQRFCGCIVRTEQYWNEYLSKELDGSLFVLQKQTTTDDEDDKSIIMAWISLRRRGPDRWQMRDFGCDEAMMTTVEERQGALRRLLNHAQEMSIAKSTGDGNNNMSNVYIHLPSFLVDEFELSKVSWISSVCEENDEGWMYRILNEADDVSIIERSNAVAHLLWPADSF